PPCLRSFPTRRSSDLEDERGKYSLVRLDSKTLGYVASLDYPILGNDGHEYFPEQPEGKSKVARWRWGKDKVAAERAALVFENGLDRKSTRLNSSHVSI